VQLGQLAKVRAGHDRDHDDRDAGSLRASDQLDARGKAACATGVIVVRLGCRGVDRELKIAEPRVDERGEQLRSTLADELPRVGLQPDRRVSERARLGDHRHQA
jgi:hypothetical protein